MNSSFYLVLLVGAITAKKLPSYLEPCPKSEIEAGLCIIKNVKILQPKIEKGIPELLIPALNPLILSSAKLETGGLIADFTNVKLYNLHNFELRAVKFNLETLNIEISIKFPIIIGRADYTLKGKILILEVNSKGKSEGNFTNLEAVINGKAKRVDKNGKKYIKVEDADIKLKVEGASLVFENLFPQKELTDNANKVINDNIQDVLKDFLPLVGKTVKGIIMGIADRIFNKFSFDELFP